MKIGIVGNMNNMYFPLARYLADEGYDCDLLLFDYEPSHFHPSADSFHHRFKFEIKQLSWGDPAKFFSTKKQAEKDLQKYDVLIGSGTAPAFVNRMGRTLDLFIPYGDDLYRWPFAPLVKPVRQLAYIGVAWHQRRGIKNCPYILFDRAGNEFEKVFDRLNYKGERIVSPAPLFYYKEYEQELFQHITDNLFINTLKELRADNDLLVLQHVRQFWKSYKDKWHIKGNDHLLKGFAQFIKTNPEAKAKLLLFEYGRDVHHSKKLIEKLGIEKNVVWFPKMDRKYLIFFIKMADVVVGELYHSWNTYCIVHETLAMSKPLLHKRHDRDMNGVYKELYPMLYADSSETVFQSLRQVAENKTAVQAIGREGYEWFLTYCVNHPLNYIRKIIGERQKHA